MRQINSHAIYFIFICTSQLEHIKMLRSDENQVELTPENKMPQYELIAHLSDKFCYLRKIIMMLRLLFTHICYFFDMLINFHVYIARVNSIIWLGFRAHNMLNLLDLVKCRLLSSFQSSLFLQWIHTWLTTFRTFQIYRRKCYYSREKLLSFKSAEFQLESYFLIFLLRSFSSFGTHFPISRI